MNDKEFQAILSKAQIRRGGILASKSWFIYSPEEDVVGAGYSEAEAVEDLRSEVLDKRARKNNE